MNYRTAFTRLKLHEGLELMPYQCTAGKTTIGIGRNLTDNGITEEEAYYLFKNDLRRTIEEVDYLLGDYKSNLDENRYYVLADMCFNLGIKRISSFKKMWKALKKDIPDYHEASKEMLDSKWARQVGDRALRLAHCMKYGIWELTEFERP